ncbi:MAG: tRNA lysidine(34) synthetase TilS [Bacteroidales bacterium]|nr:tRNA lysidine(34) synthetase TilS [Bacteroidales bacterium]
MLSEQVEKYIIQNLLFEKNDKILVALSGGADSTALLHILKNLNFTVAAAHVNFKLREKDSDEDELFTEKLCSKLNIQLFKISFNTKKIAEKNKLSIEETARTLRYNWFEEIRTQHNYKYIATGHHLDDRIETFFINLTKGTGIKGLRSILAKNNHIVRPLLFASKDNIENYCSENKIQYRTDKSNFDTNFLRNKFRHKILPVFSEINPKFTESMLKNFRIYSEFEDIYKQYIGNEIRNITEFNEKLLYIDIKRLLIAVAPVSLLYEIIHPYGFKSSQNEHIFNNINNLQSGKIFYSQTHRLLKDRNFLIIDKIQHNKKDEIFLIDKNTETVNNPINISFKLLTKFPGTFKTDKFTVYADVDKLNYPLKIRKFKQGDYFCPFGMKRKKLLSDFFTDEKINLFKKEKIWLLTTFNDEIVWIFGYRADNRFRITSNTENILQIKRF